MRAPFDLSLYLVLDPEQCGGHAGALDVTRAALEGGATVVQLRAPEWHKRAWLALAQLKQGKNAEAKAMEAGLPPHVALPIHAATNDHGLGICIWEGESVDAVREVVESAVGPWAQNEYYEMHVDGLTPQLAK